MDKQDGRNIITVDKYGDIIFHDKEVNSLVIVIMNLIVDHILARNTVEDIVIKTSDLSIKMGSTENEVLEACMIIFDSSITTFLDGKTRILTGYEFNPRSYDITLHLNEEITPYLERYRTMYGMFKKGVDKTLSEESPIRKVGIKYETKYRR